VAALDRLAGRSEPAPLPVIIERTSGLVVDRLVAAGHPVVPVHPTAFWAARPRWGAAGAKPDAGDSYQLADYPGTGWTGPTRACRSSRPWCGCAGTTCGPHRGQHEARRPAGGALARTKAVSYRLASPIALAFLADYPTQAAARLGATPMASLPPPPQLPRRQATSSPAGQAALGPDPPSRHPTGHPGHPRPHPGPAAAHPGGDHRRPRGGDRQACRLPSPGQAAGLAARGTINLAQLLAEVGPILDRVDSAKHAAAECGAAPVTRPPARPAGSTSAGPPTVEPARP
jgi:hypothetical protein